MTGWPRDDLALGRLGEVHLICSPNNMSGDRDGELFQLTNPCVMETSVSDVNTSERVERQRSRPMASA